MVPAPDDAFRAFRNGKAAHGGQPQAPSPGASAEAKARARRYMEAMPGGVSGDRGNGHAYYAARILFHDFGLPPEDAWELLACVYNPKCDPSWDEPPLRKIFNSAIKGTNAKKPRGWRLDRRPDAPWHKPGIDPGSDRPGAAPDGMPDSYEPPGAGSNVTFDPAELGDVPPDEPDEDDGRWRFRPMTAGVFAAADFRREWAVQRCLVMGRPAVFGGPMKALKTSTLADLCVSLASGTPFLGRFAVYKRRRVVMFSGETGDAALRGTFERVCAARGLTLESLTDHLSVQPDLPQLGRLEDMLELQRGLIDGGYEIVVVDPLYLCLLAGSGADGPDEKSVFKMGEHLLAVARLCRQAGATPVLAHHTIKGVDQTAAIELRDLAYAGIAEFARQWILINRATPYRGDGEHDMHLSFGGSDGQSGQWRMRVSEGTLSDDFTGMRWEVSLSSGDDVRAEKADAAERRKAEQAERQRRKFKEEESDVLAALDTVTTTQDAATQNDLLLKAGMSLAKFRPIIGRLLEEGFVAECEFEKKTGATYRKVDGYKRSQPRSGRPPRDADDADDSGILPFESASSASQPARDADDADSPRKGESARQHRTASGRTAKKRAKKTAKKKPNTKPREEP